MRVIREVPTLRVGKRPTERSISVSITSGFVIVSIGGLIVPLLKLHLCIIYMAYSPTEPILLPRTRPIR